MDNRDEIIRTQMEIIRTQMETIKAQAETIDRLINNQMRDPVGEAERPVEKTAQEKQPGDPRDEVIGSQLDVISALIKNMPNLADSIWGNAASGGNPAEAKKPDPQRHP